MCFLVPMLTAWRHARPMRIQPKGMNWTLDTGIRIPRANGNFDNPIPQRSAFGSSDRSGMEIRIIRSFPHINSDHPIVPKYSFGSSDRSEMEIRIIRFPNVSRNSYIRIIRSFPRVHSDHPIVRGCSFGSSDRSGWTFGSSDRSGIDNRIIRPLAKVHADPSTHCPGAAYLFARHSAWEGITLIEA